MKAVIQAGGLGIRISALRSDLPKPMLEIAGKPILQWQIDCLQKQGITEITIIIGHLGDSIKSYFGDQVDYIVESEPLGTAGALYYLKEKVKKDFLLINGDIVFDIDFHRFISAHNKMNSSATVLVHPNNHPFDSGLIEYSKDNKIINWYSKGNHPNWYNNCTSSGIYILSPKIIESIPEPAQIDLDREILKPLVCSNKLFAYQSPEYIFDIGTPERFYQAGIDIKSGVVKAKNLKNRQKAVFIDRDGTINKHVGFLDNINDFELISGVAAIIRKINQSGYLALCVTNQPIIARGNLNIGELHNIHQKMETLLGNEGAYLDDIVFCPHHPDKGFSGEIEEFKIACSCRKPNAGMIVELAERYNIDLSQSVMVGDSEVDRIAADRAGCWRYYNSLEEFDKQNLESD